MSSMIRGPSLCPRRIAPATADYVKNMITGAAQMDRPDPGRERKPTADAANDASTILLGRSGGYPYKWSST